MAYDVVVVGAGTAGCVLAARLSEESERTVCLLEAGPDYGPRVEGRWPEDILDPRALAFSHDWGVGGEDDRSLGSNAGLLTGVGSRARLRPDRSIRLWRRGRACRGRLPRV